MAHVPKSFDEAFRRIRVELVDHIYVWWRLWNLLLKEGLLNQRHVNELKVSCILQSTYTVVGVLLKLFRLFGNFW